MLKDLKPKEKEAPVENTEEPFFAEEFCSLGSHLEENHSVEFDYKGKTLRVSGINCDFKVLLDGNLVCEVVYDNIYNLNEELAKEILL